MKIKSVLFRTLYVLAIVLCMIFFSACGDNCGNKEDPNSPEPGIKHECESECPVCGGCLDGECTDDACVIKCGESYLYGETYTAAEELKVAKAGLTYDKNKAYYVGFNKENEGAVSYKIQCNDDIVANLSVSVYKNASEDVFTDVITVEVNGTEISRPGVITAGNSVAVVNLGCIELNNGVNTIDFIAEGDGTHVHEFLGISIAYDGENTALTLLPAEQIPHTCDSECEVCGGCTDFSCLNPGCASKCSCDSGTHKAHIFTVLDDRADNHDRGINGELDGVGCTWDKETRITYEINSSIAGTVKFGAVVSQDTKENVKFTDQFKLTVNGTQVHGDGTMPVSESGLREWNIYEMVVVGDITLREGRNVIDISQTPRKSVTNAAYNFQSMIIFSETGEFDWYQIPVDSEHTLTKVEAKAATCKETGNIEYWYCSHCDRYFSDEYAESEITDISTLTLPVDPSNHSGDGLTAEDGVTVTCADCGELLRYNFNGMDERCIFEGAEKNTDEQMLPGKNGVMTTITYYIVSDKDTTATMLVNCTAIATSWEVEFYKTWDVQITSEGVTEPVSYKSETIHHHESQGKPAELDRFHWYVYEEVATVTLKAGVNKVQLIGTGKEQLNFRDLAFADVTNDAVLSWGTAPAPETGDGHPLTHVPAQAATCSATGNSEYWYCETCDKYYSDETGNVEVEDPSTLTLPVDPTNHGEEVTAEDGVTVTCGDCSSLLRYNFNGMDDRCIFEGGVKNTEEQCLPGKNGTVTTITYYIVSDKDTTATLLANCSAIAASWQVEFYKTWNVQITAPSAAEPVSYKSETIHHYQNQGMPEGITSRFNWYEYETVATVELKAGVNKVQFISVGGQDELNFRDLAFADVTDGAVLSWGTAPDIEEGGEEILPDDYETEILPDGN